MKHIIKCFLSILLFTNLLVIIVKANPTVNFDSDAIKSYTDVISEDVNGVATINSTTITSYNKRIIDETKLANHKSYWLEPNVSILDSDLRIVNYTAGTNTMWQGKKPTDLAKIYERENPGWIVVGGTNGDFFWITDNCEIDGTSMQEGDFYKAYEYTAGQHKALGFKDDGSYTFGTVTVTPNEMVQVLNNDNEYVDVTEIKGIDVNPKETGVTMLTRFDLTTSPNKYIPLSEDLPYDLTDYTVYKVKYDVQRLDRDNSNHHGEHKIFIKGTITEITTNQKTYRIDDDESSSYLVCKDGSLANLQVGDYVRCQYNLTGDWEGVTNITGAFNHILTKGEVIDWTGETNVATDYVNAIKNRTIMGFKADGTPIMMVVEKGSYGASYEECGEILKGLGCVEGFLFDGGGSSCIFVRDENGDFTTLNNHEDGQERRDGNAVLLVMRDPGFQINTEEVTRFGVNVKLDIKNAEYFNALKDVKITVNGETKDYNAEGVLFEGLNENTEYKVNVTYSIKQHPDIDKYVLSAQSASAKTLDFIRPNPGLRVTDVSSEEFKVVKDTTLDTASWISNVVIYVDNIPYEMGNNDSVLCDGLRKNSEYEVYYSYVVTDPETGNRYNVNSTKFTVKTLAFAKPVIVSISESVKTSSVLGIKYEYKDPDSKVTSAYILCNETQYSATNKNGTISISGLDFANNTYNIKLVLEYENEAGKTILVESEVLTYEASGAAPAPKPSTGCNMGSVELVISLLSLTSLLAFVVRKRH